MPGQIIKDLLFLRFLPARWRVPYFILGGIACGLGTLTLIFSNFTSYIVETPATCVNCHIMAPHYATWFHSSHREHATCSDCHVPQDNIFRQFLFKGMDGARHTLIFTLRTEPNVIKIHNPGKTVVQENCIRCHFHTNENVSSGKITLQKAIHGEGKLCWECHREVPHGRVRGGGSTPLAQVPLPASPVPPWLQKLIDSRE